jgi:hypothetical protein
VVVGKSRQGRKKEPLRYDVDTWRPLMRWTMQDVVDIHKRHGLRPNPLYLKGASRVGCWPCVFLRKSDLALLARIDPERRSTSSASSRRPSTSRTRKATPASTRCGPDNVKHLQAPIDDVIEWAKTGKGGKQKLLPLVEDPPDIGCMRWVIGGYDKGISWAEWSAAHCSPRRLVRPAQRCLPVLAEPA